MKENDRGTGHIPLLAYYGGHENRKPVYLSERGDKCADRNKKWSVTIAVVAQMYCLVMTK